MEEDCYQVEVLYMLNPYLIWIEVKNPRKSDEFVFEQIGLFGILPQDNVLCIERGLRTERCLDWKPAASNILKRKLSEAAEVWFSPIHVDRRSSIFDNKIHKFGELVIKKHDGKSKPLSKYIVKSKFAKEDHIEFYTELTSGKLQTKLDNETTDKVIKQLAKCCKTKNTPKNLWEKSIKKQTQVSKSAYNLEVEMSLTSKNLEKFNSDIAKLLEKKLKDLELCKEYDEESIGRGTVSNKPENKIRNSALKRKMDLIKAGQKKHEIPHRHQDPSHILELTKKFLEDNATFNKVPVKIPQTQPVMDSQNDMVAENKEDIEICEGDDKIKGVDLEWDDDFELEPQRVKGARKTKKPQKHIMPPDQKHPEKVNTVVYGPPGINPTKLSPKPLPQEDIETLGKKEFEESNVNKEDNFNYEKDLNIEVKNKNKLNEYIKNVTLKTLKEDDKVKLASKDNKVKMIPVEKCYKSDSSILQRKLKLYQDSLQKYNTSVTSESDTTVKDDSSSLDEEEKREKHHSDSESEKEIQEIIRKLKLSKTDDKPCSIVAPNVSELPKNHVNPFQNVEPHLSVFVDKLVRPILMVHTKVDRRIQPCINISEVHFNRQIHTMLRNMGIEKPMMLQYVSWQTILRGYSMFMVCPLNSGKTLGYLPAVCRHVTDFVDFASENRKSGPSCIILCGTSNAVSEVERLAKIFLGVKEKVLSFYSGMDDLDITTGLLNGCDLLICTPPVLARILHFSAFSLDLSRLAICVLDDCERLQEVYEMEVKFFLYKIKEALKTRVDKILKVQYIVASRIWCDFMEPLAKKAPDAVVCFSAFQECVLYSKANTTVNFVKEQNKINILLDFINGIDTSKKTVIVCQKDEEVEVLEKVLKINKYTVFACNNSMTIHDLYDLNRCWSDYKELPGFILVCCDGNLTHMNITDAHHLVHYSLPQLFSMFCRRFAVLNDNYSSIFKNNNQNVNVKILLEKDNIEQLPKILNFIKRCTSDVPNALNEVCQKVLDEKDAKKAQVLVPICDTLLSLGKCVDFWNCKERHSVFKEHDEPKDWMPTQGVITFNILHYHSAALYSGRLLTNLVNGRTKNYPQTYNELSLKLGMYFSKTSNKKLHGIPKVGDICAVSVKEGFFARCQVLKIVTKYQKGNPNEVVIRLIDEEKIEKSRDIYLYYLPEELRRIETHVVQVRLSNIKPKDNDIFFSKLARHQLKKITDKDEDLFMRARVVMTVGNCVFVDTLEACQDLTSINEVVVKYDFKRMLLETHGVINDDHIEEIDKICKNGGLDIKVASVEVPKPTIVELPKSRWAHLEDGSYSTVFFASAENPGQFFIRLVKFESCMNLLIKDINKYIEEGEHEKVEEVKVGDIVLAKFPDDSTYERARIENIVNKDKVKCFFVDQGDWREVLNSDLAKITPNFITRMPFQAIECKLIGVKAYGESWTEFGSNWLCDNFYQEDGSLKQLYVKYFTKEIAEYTGGHRYGIVIVDTYSERDVIINQLMIDVNLAQEDEEEIQYLDDLNFKRKLEDQSDEDDNDWEKPKDLIPCSVVKPENNASQVPFDKLFLKQPIRSVPLVASDDDMSDVSDKWNVNLGKEFMEMFKPLFGQKNLATVTDTVTTKTVTLPSITANDLQSDTDSTVQRSISSGFEVIQSPKLKEIDSDDLSSPDTTNVSVTLATKHPKPSPPLLNIVDQSRKPKLVWRQNKTSVTIKIQLIGIEDYKLEIIDRSLKFSACANETDYAFEFELYGIVNKDKTTHSNKGQYILVKLVKSLNKNWLTLTRDGGIKKWIVYDVDSIDASSDEEPVPENVFANIVKKMHFAESESDDEDFHDDVSQIYKRDL